MLSITMERYQEYMNFKVFNFVKYFLCMTSLKMFATLEINSEECRLIQFSFDK